jgi:hypothetical protein
VAGPTTADDDTGEVPAAKARTASPGAGSSGAATSTVSTSAAPVTQRRPPAPSPAVPPTVGRVPTVHEPVRAPVTAAPVAAAPRPSGVRRARLVVSRVDPWSVLKTSFMLAVSLGVVALVASALLWATLDVLGVFATLSRIVADITGTGTTQFDLESLLSFSRVMGVALVLAALEIVLVSVLATLFAFLYNLVVGITGGLEVTLSEDS